MPRCIPTLLAFALAAGFVPPAAADTFKLDRAHSSVTFKVRHLMANAGGEFDDFDATIELDPKAPEKSAVRFAVKAASIDTDNASRDEHLRSADFFDVAQHPEITFASTGIKPIGGNRYEVSGKLTIRGVTRDVTIPVSYLGTAAMGGKTKAGFEAAFTVDRKDYGIVWNRALDNGGYVLSDEVRVEVDIEADQVPAAAPAAATSK